MMLTCSFGVRWPVASSSSSTASLTSLIHTCILPEPQLHQLHCNTSGSWRPMLTIANMRNIIEPAAASYGKHRAMQGAAEPSRNDPLGTILHQGSKSAHLSFI